MISFVAKVKKLGDQFFIRIPDEIVKRYKIKIGDELVVRIIKKA
jgi:antitoxin component of MazEF toxin-antitoxin module